MDFEKLLQEKISELGNRIKIEEREERVPNYVEHMRITKKALEFAKHLYKTCELNKKLWGG